MQLCFMHSASTRSTFTLADWLLEIHVETASRGLSFSRLCSPPGPLVHCTKSLLRWPPHTVSLGQTFRTSGRRQVQIRLLTAATPVSNAERPTAGAGLQAIRAWHAPRAQPKLSARASFNFRPFGPQKDRFDQASSDQASSFLVPGPHYTAGRAIEARWQNHRSRTRLWQHSLYTASVESNFKSTLTPTQTCNSVRSSLGPSASVLGVRLRLSIQRSHSSIHIRRELVGTLIAATWIADQPLADRSRPGRNSDIKTGARLAHGPTRPVSQSPAHSAFQRSAVAVARSAVCRRPRHAPVPASSVGRARFLRWTTCDKPTVHIRRFEPMQGCLWFNFESTWFLRERALARGSSDGRQHPAGPGT